MLLLLSLTSIELRLKHMRLLSHCIELWLKEFTATTRITLCLWIMTIFVAMVQCLLSIITLSFGSFSVTILLIVGWMLRDSFEGILTSAPKVHIWWSAATFLTLWLAWGSLVRFTHLDIVSWLGTRFVIWLFRVMHGVRLQLSWLMMTDLAETLCHPRFPTISCTDWDPLICRLLL